jgi:hypothetical protein
VASVFGFSGFLSPALRRDTSSVRVRLGDRPALLPQICDVRAQRLHHPLFDLSARLP